MKYWVYMRISPWLDEIFPHSGAFRLPGAIGTALGPRRNLDDVLAAAGQDGWELASYDSTYGFVFKREDPER